MGEIVSPLSAGGAFTPELAEQMRRALSFTQDSDFDTSNAKAKATMRFSVGWTDPLGVFGSPGA